MKKLVFALAAVALLSLTACHFRQDEAKETLERNDLYKGDKTEYSVNRAGEGGKPAKTEVTTVPAAEETKADSTAAPAAPAEHHAEHH